MRGVFVAFEGIDGCGKTTQLKKFFEYLFSKNKHNHIVITREPFRETNIRKILYEENDPHSQAEKLAELFLADRKLHTKELISPSLEKGNHVITDRYKLSTISYQHAQGMEIEKLISMHDGLPVPDLTFVIDVPATEATKRMQKEEGRKAHKFEANLEFLEKVRMNFHKAKENLKDEKIFIIDGTKNPEEIFSEIKKIFEGVLAEKNRGKFIVLEGTDGTGKATQANLLIEKLKNKGHQVALMDFPQYGKNTFARAVESYLRGEFGPSTEINPYLISFAYAGDRAKKADEIKKLLADGVTIVSNRYTSASMGHQGGKIKDKLERKKFLDWLKELEYGEDGHNIPKPDLTCLLYLNPEISQKLVDNKAMREYTQGQKRDGHEGNLQHLNDAANAFLEIAREEKNWHIIDCGDTEKNTILPREEISKRIWDIIQSKL